MTQDRTWRVSPYCVFHVDPDGATAHLVHAFHGSRFSMPLTLWSQVLALTASDDARRYLDAAPEDVQSVVKELVEERILTVDAPAAGGATGQPFRNRLTPIELAFHRGVDEGGYFPDQVDRADPPPAFKPPHADEAIALPPPADLQDVTPTTLAESLARRRSVRQYGPGPLSGEALSTWLHATLRTRRVLSIPELGDVSRRSYPSAGARHALEGYLVVRDVESLAPGVYHYHPLTHTLRALASASEHRDALFGMAMHRMAAPGTVPPHVLMVVTAVFARTCWKYRGMPYHAILLETGALYQTVSLVATALGLAPCPIGAFPERAIGEILALDPLDEAPVGLIALGVPASTPAPRRITACRLVQPSPFATSAREEAVELVFADGVREVLPRSALRVHRQPDGRLGCDVASEPGLAVFDDACREDVLRWGPDPGA